MNRVLRVYSGRNRPPLAPVYRMFTELTGIAVEVMRVSHHEVCDRVVAERNDPQADLLITNTQVKPELVRASGVFAPYAAPVARDLAPWLRADDFSWLSFTAWPRTAMVNLATMGADTESWPGSIADLTAPRFRDRLVIASIQETMTAAYFAALRVVRGDGWTLDLLDRLLANGMRIYKANIDVRAALVRQRYGIALANGSNTHVFRMEGHAVAEAWLDQEEGGLGTNVETHTAAVLSGARNPEAARAFIDFLLSRDIQELLARMYGETPVNPAAATGWVRPLDRIRRIPASLPQIGERLASTVAALRQRGFDMADVTSETVSAGADGRRTDDQPIAA
jgi:iron(III) transport system substrate-binding protein